MRPGFARARAARVRASFSIVAIARVRTAPLGRLRRLLRRRVRLRRGGARDGLGPVLVVEEGEHVADGGHRDGRVRCGRGASGALAG